MLQMQRRLWVRIPLALVVISLLIWVMNRADRSATARHLPDGTIVTIRKVSFGKSVRIPTGTLWQRIAGQSLPSTISKRLGIRTAAYTNASDTTFVVVETLRTNGTFAAAPKAMPVTFNTDVLLSDDAGNEFHLTRVLQVQKTSNTLTEVFVTPLVSHVATQFRLQLHQSDWSSFPASIPEIVVPNPARRTTSRWTAGHLPMTNMLDDLAVVLSSIQPVPSPRTSARSPLRSPRSTAQLRIFESGAVSTNWLVRGFTVRDEEGNISSSAGYFSPLEPRQFRFELTRAAASSPDDIVTIRDVHLPGPADAFAMISTQFDGFTIQVRHFSRGQVSYTMSSHPANMSHRLMIEFDDANGNRRTAFNQSQGRGVNVGVGFSPPIPDSVQSADISFAFTTNRFVEFLTAPEPAAPDSSNSK